MEENQINVLYVEPKKVPVAAVIGKELESYQEAVGGMIEVIYPFDDMVCIVCNEEGKLNGLDLNRALYFQDGEIYDIIAGSFFVTGITEDDFCSLTEEQMKKYQNRFKEPEMFVRMGSKILSIPVPEKEIRNITGEKKPQEKRKEKEMDGER